MEIARLYWDVKREEIVVLMSPKTVMLALQQVAEACETVYSGTGAAVPMRIAKATNEAVQALANDNGAPAPQQARKQKEGENDAEVENSTQSARIASAEGAEVATEVPRPQKRASTRSSLFGGLT